MGEVNLKYFRNIGIIAITLFSFYYTEKIANLTLENNEIYKSIKEESSGYEVASVNAKIEDDYIIPGLNGKTVDIKDSYYNMKDINVFNSYYLIYDTSYPEVTLENNRDKIIKQGNGLKQSVAFVLEYDKDLLNFFKDNKIEASVLVDTSSFNKDETLEQINNESDKFNNLEALLNKYSNNVNICYINDKNDQICRKNKKFLVKSDKVLNNSTFKDIKNNIMSGDIYYVEKNMDKNNLKLIINSILYKDLDIVRLSKLLSEERD